MIGYLLHANNFANFVLKLIKNHAVGNNNNNKL